MIYLDSCALVKLIRQESESAALRAWLDEQPDAVIATSELAQAEVLRVIRRNNHTDQGVLVDPAELANDLTEAYEVLARVAQVTVDRDLLVMTGAYPAPMVRTLDAIHLVSALMLENGGPQFVTYDRRLAAAAREAGLDVVAPR